MASDIPILQPAESPPVFAIACWILALMAFCQFLVAGMALANRFEQSQQVRTVIKEVPKIVRVRVGGNGPENTSPSVVSRPPLAPPTASLPLPKPSVVAMPTVADPRAERLVKEARQARVAGDMGRAVVKLEEALAQASDDATVHYEFGLVHEQMGVFDTASAHYEKVFQMGVEGAGSLYELAAAKLRDGFAQQDAMLGKLSLARVRIFKDENFEEGQRVILSIPVQKAPGEAVEVSEVEVSTMFFNRNSKGEIIQLEDKSWVTEQWVSERVDWGDGEETLRMTYVIPEQDEQTQHLFGQRTYYGQVVSLIYKGEVLDVQAWPRDLAARMPKSANATANGPAEQVFPEFQDSLPPDFDPSMILPPLPELPK